MRITVTVRVIHFSLSNLRAQDATIIEGNLYFADLYKYRDDMPIRK